MTRRLSQAALDRIEVERQRKAHLAEHVAGCGCLWCVGVAGLRAELEARRKAEAERNGEPPF